MKWRVMHEKDLITILFPLKRSWWHCEYGQQQQHGVLHGYTGAQTVFVDIKLHGHAKRNARQFDLTV